MCDMPDKNHRVGMHEEREAEFQAVVGARPRSIVTEMEREARKYHEAHSIASESNLTLHKAMQLHVKNLKLLGSPMQDIQASIPTLGGLDPATEASLRNMRRIIAKVEEEKSGRWWQVKILPGRLTCLHCSALPVLAT